MSTLYRSPPPPPCIPAADRHAAGTVHAADSRRLEYLCFTAAAASRTVEADGSQVLRR